MAITVEVLDQGQSTTDANSYDTASVDVVAGDYLLLFQINTKSSSADLGFCFPSGLGATWVNGSGSGTIASAYRCKWHAAIVPATVSGVVTMAMADAPGTTPLVQDGCMWVLYRVAGADTSTGAGIGGGAIEQWKRAQAGDDSPTVTLDAESAATSLVLAGIMTTHGPVITGTAETGWTEDVDDSYSSTHDTALLGYHQSESAAVTTVAPTTLSSGGATWEIIAVEVKSGGGITNPRINPSTGLRKRHPAAWLGR